MLAEFPLLVVTFGADIKSTPFCWLSARITIWNWGFVKTPAIPNMAGDATLAPWGTPAIKASKLLAVIAEFTSVPIPERFPAVMGLEPTLVNGKLL